MTETIPPRYGPKPTQVETRFFAKIKQVGECWIWTGGKTINGYGCFRVGSLRNGTRKISLAHRWSFERFNGQLTDGLECDHLCRNRACVNPAHLEQVTGLVNNRRSDSMAAMNARKTHCNNGHQFDKLNTYVIKGKWRACRACRRFHHSAAKRQVNK